MMTNFNLVQYACMKRAGWTVCLVAASLLSGCGGAPTRNAGDSERIARPAETAAGSGVTTPAAKAPAGDAPVVAISQINGQGVTQEEVALVTDMVRQELMATGKFRVIDRSNMDKILGEKVLQLSGAGSDAESVQFGKLLNARLSGAGSFGKLMGSYVLNFRLVDVETGEAKYAGSSEGNTLADLRKGIHKFAGEFAGR
jgi:curli biogenesis system outer membrane secretion channel CsgG